MKKYLFFMMSVMLLLMAGTMLTACSSDNDDPKIPSPETPIEEIRHIDGTIVTIPGDKSNYDALYNFFNKELPSMSTSRQSNNFLFDNLSDIYYFINSYDELRSVYTGKEPLPDIDFGSYTLIVGQKCSNNMYDSFDKQSFYERDGRYILDLFFSSEIIHPMIVYYNYWGLYPKLDKKEISVNINLNKVL